MYSHPRFMDVAFRCRQCGFYGGKWKFKAEWFVRGRDIGITSKPEVTQSKAREFLIL